MPNEGHTSFSLFGIEILPTSKRYFLSERVVLAGYSMPVYRTVETRMETCKAAPLEPYRSLDRQLCFDPKLVAEPSRFANSDRSHCVLMATLVEPRVTPLLLKRTKIRLAAGSNGTVPSPCTKTAKVGVALALIVVVTLLPIVEMH